jgi:serine protease
MKTKIWFIVSVISTCLIFQNAFAKTSYALIPDSGKVQISDLWAIQILNIIQQKASQGTVIKVAVVDDGFRLSHKALKDFIFTNEKEIPGNFQDDDGNGFNDDIHGWDISDNDNDVSVKKGSEEVYFHGTYIAGIITSVFQQCFGNQATEHLKIIPVKVLSDHAKNTYLADGYKGIKYACDIGADIICCAWSGGIMSEDDKATIAKAIRNGTIIIGSAGNFFSEKAELPSSFPGVFSVAAVDSLLRKSKVSNYSMRVDIAAPGVSVFGPFPLADNSYTYDNGTSPATALVTGCVAILKALKPDATSTEILDAIKSTATPIDSLNLTYCGKLGSGLPNMTKAIEFIKNPESRNTAFNPDQPEGKIFYNRKQSPTTYQIQPYGAYQGIHIYSASADYKGRVKLYNSDSIWYSGTIAGISQGLYIPGSRFRIELLPKSGLSKQMEFSYYMETIDSTTLYCKDIQEVTEERGKISDNSGNENYANNSSCKWQLTVPEGKKIKIEFEELNTQPNVDYVWVFDGTSTLQENLIAKFSGTNKPPVITSLSNQVLIWFLTDGSTVGKGWKLKYEPVE